MYKSSFLILFLFFGSAITAQTDSQKIAGLYKLELLNGQCYENLRELCKNVGTRLSGSPGAAKAVTWGFDKLKSYGFDTVYLQEITVPHWVRGKTEKAILVNTKKQLQIAALGGSVGTNGWLSGEIIEVNSNKQLDSLGKAGIALHRARQRRFADAEEVGDQVFDVLAPALQAPDAVHGPDLMLESHQGDDVAGGRQVAADVEAGCQVRHIQPGHRVELG